MSTSNWKEKMIERFANPDPLSSKGQFKEELRGKLWGEFEDFISTLLKEQLEAIEAANESNVTIEEIKQADDIIVNYQNKLRAEQRKIVRQATILIRQLNIVIFILGIVIALLVTK